MRSKFSLQNKLYHHLFKNANSQKKKCELSSLFFQKKKYQKYIKKTFQQKKYS